MALKSFKPVTPGLRQLVIVDRSELYKGKPVKKLTEGKSSSGGRNNLGRITVRFRGGGHKRTLRLVDFKRRGRMGDAAVVERIEYDPNRTAFIALIRYADGEQSYILAPQRLAVGDQVVAGDQVDIKPGNAMPLGNMPVGTIIHNVELKIGRGGAMARSAGTYAQIVGRDQGYVTVRLNSGEQRLVHGQCYATVGDRVVAGEQVDIKPGNAMPMGNMPVGTIVHNIETKIGAGGALARSAGTYAQIVGRDQGYVTLRLNSGEQRLVHGQCFATVGAVSNPDHMNISVGKAGRTRWLGRRPHNRGVTMNPIDHPHGGGEGRTSGGRHPVTPWGKDTKGTRTRNTNKASQRLIVRSRHAKKGR